MPKTRLYKADREAICRAIIEHKFSPIEAALLVEENALANEAREIAYDKHLKVIETLPNGAFPTKISVRVTVEGEHYALYFGGRIGGPDAVRRRVFEAHEYSPILQMTDDAPFGARVKDWAQRGVGTKAERELLTRRTDATLSRFSTFDALIEAWPEANKFIAERWRTRPAYVAALPAVVMSELSSALDLPPDDDESTSAAPQSAAFKHAGV